MKAFNIILRILCAVILFQTLFFKFSGAPESVYIFTELHAEPVGRFLSGIIELIAGILLLVPSTQIFGALLTFAIMLGAILSHIFVLGFNIQNDGGLLFSLALFVFSGSGIILYLNRFEIVELLNKKLNINLLSFLK